MPKISISVQKINRKSSSQSSSAKIETIVSSFNTWSFKREQPSDVKLIREHVATAVGQHTPVPFVLYWGKGPRSAVAAPDLSCLDYLLSMTRRILDAYDAGASVTLLLTDSHATLNGHAAKEIDAYYSDIMVAASARKFYCRRLSELTLSSETDTAPASLCSIQPDILSTLTRSAAKWYDGAEPPEIAAEKYYAMNMLERTAVQQAYKDHIFITFNGSEHRPLFPDLMPIFYMYSIKKGTAVKPWFLSSDGSQLTMTRARNSSPDCEGAQYRQAHQPSPPPV